MKMIKEFVKRICNDVVQEALAGLARRVKEVQGELDNLRLDYGKESTHSSQRFAVANAKITKLQEAEPRATQAFAELDSKISTLQQEMIQTIARFVQEQNEKHASAQKDLGQLQELGRNIQEAGAQHAAAIESKFHGVMSRIVNTNSGARAISSAECAMCSLTVSRFRVENGRAVCANCRPF